MSMTMKRDIAPHAERAATLIETMAARIFGRQAVREKRGLIERLAGDRI